MHPDIWVIRRVLEEYEESSEPTELQRHHADGTFDVVTLPPSGPSPELLHTIREMAAVVRGVQDRSQFNRDVVALASAVDGFRAHHWLKELARGVVADDPISMIASSPLAQKVPLDKIRVAWERKDTAGGVVAAVVFEALQAGVRFESSRLGGKSTAQQVFDSVRKVLERNEATRKNT